MAIKILSDQNVSANVIATTAFRLNTDSKWKIRGNTNSTQLAFEYSTSSTLSDSDIKVLIEPSGAVGIGTNSPDGNLEIITSTIVSGASDSVNNVLIGLQSANRPTIILDTADTTYTNRTWNLTNVGSVGSLFIGRNGLDVLTMANDGQVSVYNDFIINNSSPELYMQTGGSHYNWLLAAQESIDAGFEIASQPPAGGSYDIRMLIKGDTGRVAIGGTTTSANTLTLQGTGTELDLTNTSGSGKNYRFSSVSNGDLEIIDKTANAERLKLDTDGMFTFTSPQAIGVTFKTTNTSYGAMNVYKDHTGTTRGAAGYNSGAMYFGGEANTDTILQAGGQVSLYCDDGSQNVIIKGTTINGAFGASNSILAVKAVSSGGEGIIQIQGQGNNNTDTVGEIQFYSYNVSTPYAAIVGRRYTSDTEGSLVFYTSNAERFIIANDGDIYNRESLNRANTFYGYHTANASATGTSNSAYGYEALYDLTTGTNNIAIGRSALQDLTVGASNVCIGNSAGSGGDFGESVFVGYLAGQVNTQGGIVGIGTEALKNNTSVNNTAVGHRVLIANTTGDSNTGLGFRALDTNVTGNNNTAIGAEALRNTTAGSNVAVGTHSGLNTTSGSENTFLGTSAGRGITEGGFNIAIGSNALRNVTTDNHNIAIGRAAMQASTSGTQNIAIGTDSLEATSATGNVAIGYRVAIGTSQSGNYNTIIGHEAAQALDNGEQNDIIGRNAGFSLTNGSSNVTIGYQSMYANSIGSKCVAVGWRALHSDPSPEESVAVGHQALYNQLSGRNTAVGFHTLQDLSTGGYNTGVGGECMENVTTGGENTSMGAFALRFITDSSNNTAMGYKALYTQTGGSSNTGIGHQAGEFVNDARYTTLVGAQCGSLITNNDYNTMMGYYTGRNTTTGENNAFFGAIAGRFNSTGSRNTYIGCQAVDNQTHTGSDNTVIGFAAAQNIISGYDNILIGKSVASGLTTANANIGIGIDALNACTSSAGNVAIGYASMGAGVMSGTGRNIALGDASMYNVTNGQNNIAIGWNAGRSGFQTPQSLGSITTNSNEIQMGNTSHSGAYIQIGWTTVSDARDKGNVKDVPHGLDFVNQLQPKSFEFKPDREAEDTDGIERYGFLAQDVLELEGDNAVIVNKNDEDKLKMTNDYLVPILVNAIKELKAEIELLKNK
tara:strand:- start:9 stop:3521 length:3513 start_codon:yes stop_codon:yes gene_type:complete